MSDPTEFLSRTGYRQVMASSLAGSLFTSGHIVGGPFNGSGNITILTDATSANTASTIVSRDASGNFSAGTITAALTGNASTATALQTPRTIGGVSFDGTANIVPQTIQSINEATDTTCYPLFINDPGTQSEQPKNNAGFIYNSNTNALTATTFIGALTGNASTATALQTSRNIDGQSFNGTANITVIAPGTHAATSKTTPVDADEIPLADSAASFVLKKLTWANVKATLKTYFDTLYTPLTTTFTSGLQTITAAGSLTLAHGLAAAPNLIMVYLKCTIANNGFAVNDIILIDADGESGTNTGVAIWPDATNINVRFGSAAQTFQYINKTTGVRNALTNADWNFFVVAKVI